MSRSFKSLTFLIVYVEDVRFQALDLPVYVAVIRYDERVCPWFSQLLYKCFQTWQRSVDAEISDFTSRKYG